MKFMSEQARKEDSIYKTPEWLSTAQMEEDEAEGGDTNPLEIGMVCMTADPRCLDLHEHDEGADVWLSTAQMGWALGEESMEVEAPDEVSGKK